MAKPDDLNASVSRSISRRKNSTLLTGLFTFPTKSTSPARRQWRHKNMYVYRDGDGGYVFRNDESVAGFMMTQLYREEIRKPQHVFLVSPRTKGRFLSCHAYDVPGHLGYESRAD